MNPEYEPNAMVVREHVFLLSIDAASWDWYNTDCSAIDREVEGYELQDVIYNGPEGTVYRHTEKWGHVTLAGAIEAEKLTPYKTDLETTSAPYTSLTLDGLLKLWEGLFGLPPPSSQPPPDNPPHSPEG